jgi:PadR family transcriptional regulator PadR
MPEIVKSRSYFLVLLSLNDGAKHGYEIASHIKDTSKGTFNLSFGSLYPVLHKLEKDGLVKAEWEEIGEAKAKKVYSLSKAGHRALVEETKQFHVLVSAFSGMIGQLT